MKSSILTFFLSLILGTTLAHGAVITVNVGQTIQSAIDSASSGDEIIMNGAFFDEDLIINGKNLTLRKQNLIPEIKSISFNNASGISILEGLKVQQKLNASDSDLQITNVDFGGDLNTTNSSLRITGCDIIGFVLVNRGNLTITKSDIHQNVTINQGSLKLIKSTVDKDVSINHSNNSSGSPTRTIIGQSTITEKLTSKASNSLISYNTIRHSTFDGNATIIGNDFAGRNLEGIGIDLNGTNSKVQILNNRIHGYAYNSNANTSYVCIGIRVGASTSAEIINNLIYSCFDNHNLGTENTVGIGIFVQSSSGNKILGNAIWNCYVRQGTGSYPGNKLIWAPAFGTLVQNNLFYRQSNDQSSIHVGGGVFAKDTIEGNPKVNPDGTLESTSPCINKGPPDARFNDRDGSRNDIGMFGGHNFIPDGKTTDKPIVLGLDVAPTFVPVGGTVTIESTGATVK
jgi:hypothetical protein